MKNLKVLLMIIAMIGTFLVLQNTPVNAGQKKFLSKEESISKLIGKWNGYTIWYDNQDGKYKKGAEEHCQILRDTKGIKFIGQNGQALDEDNVYLSYKKGKFYGSYILGKHGGTHGIIDKVKFTLEFTNDNILVYQDSTSKHEYTKEK
ncbi:MAG: hypothetical protein ABFD76_01130 [Smithella sp.]